MGFDVAGGEREGAADAFVDRHRDVVADRERAHTSRPQTIGGKVDDAACQCVGWFDRRKRERAGAKPQLAPSGAAGAVNQCRHGIIARADETRQTKDFTFAER